MQFRPQVISKGNTFNSDLGISSRKSRKKTVFVALAMMVLLLLAGFKLKMINIGKRSSNSNSSAIVRHSNPCQHVTPEPEIILQEIFDSDDYFFPYSYKERICAEPKKTERHGNDEDLQTCFTNDYHCVTTYNTLDVVRIPYPGNLTSKYWKIEQIHVAVACECSRTEVVETFEIRNQRSIA